MDKFYKETSQVEEGIYFYIRQTILYIYTRSNMFWNLSTRGHQAESPNVLCEVDPSLLMLRRQFQDTIGTY